MFVDVVVTRCPISVRPASQFFELKFGNLRVVCVHGIDVILLAFVFLHKRHVCLLLQQFRHSPLIAFFSRCGGRDPISIHGRNQSAPVGFPRALA